MITILASFTAYPGGKKREFKAGETVDDLPEAVAALYRDKGLAVAKKPEKAK